MERKVLKRWIIRVLGLNDMAGKICFAGIAALLLTPAVYSALEGMGYDMDPLGTAMIVISLFVVILALAYKTLK